MIQRIIYKTVHNRFIESFKIRSARILASEGGMELVQVAILVAIAIAVGLIFKDKIGDFVNEIFNNLTADSFDPAGK